MVRSHPAARDVRIVVGRMPPVEAWIDAKKLGRTIYNLLLNACQAAHRGKESPLVTVSHRRMRRRSGSRLRITARA